MTGQGPPNPVEKWHEQSMREYAEQVARGEHDEQCELGPHEVNGQPTFLSCHVSGGNNGDDKGEFTDDYGDLSGYGPREAHQ